jgi:hypothetical protein
MSCTKKYGISQQENTIAEQLSIELQYINPPVKPGTKPITSSSELLSKIVPELKKPRFMTVTDIGDIDKQNSFLEERYSFVLRDDFNKDGFADVAFVGKYENDNNPDENTFFTIFSFRGKKLVRDYFTTLKARRVFLLKDLNFRHGFNGIILIYAPASDFCGTLYWSGSKYDYEPCQSVF